MKLKHGLLSLFCFLTIHLTAQDFQYSYWQMTPISYNPAYTGAFYGNLRVSGLIRDQWRTVTVSGQEYQTISLGFDGNIPFGLKDTDWISAGMNIARDQSGISQFKHTFSGLSLAYHLTLGKKAETILTIGGKYGSYSKGPIKQADYLTSFNIQDANTQDQDLNSLTLTDPTSDFALVSSNDLMLGVMLFSPMGKTSAIRVGLAMDHVLKPDLSVTRDSMNVGGPQTLRDELDRRINVHAQLYTDISDRVTLTSTILYQKMGPASNILVQGMVSYAHNPQKEIYLNGGVGLRLADNSFIPVYFGVDVKDWRFGLSYSINMSGFSQMAREGGFELAASKIFSWNKKTKVKPKFVCPRL